MNDRQTYLSGSDIANILGFGSLTPYETYLLKKGEIEIPQTPQMAAGKALESAIRNLYQQTIPSLAGGWLSDQGSSEFPLGYRYIHPKYPFLKGHLDDFHTVKKIVGEFKATRYSVIECPIKFKLQTAFYCLLTEAVEGHVAVLHNTTDFTVFPYVRNKALESLIMEKALHFWEYHIQQDNPPMARTLEDIKAQNKRLYDSLREEPLIATEGLQERIVAYQNSYAELKEKQKACEAMKVEILKEIQHHEVLVNAHNELLATYKYDKMESEIPDKKLLMSEFPDVWEKVKKKRAKCRRLLIK